MNEGIISLLVFFLLIAGTAGGIIALSALIGRKEAPAGRYENYECGLEQASSPRRRFPIKFFLTAMLFIVFDVEVVLLFPWAVAFREAVAEGIGMALLLEVAFFLFLLGVALAFAVGRGALKWEE